MRRLLAAAAAATITMFCLPTKALEIPLSAAGAKEAVAQGASYKNLPEAAHSIARIWDLIPEADTPAPAGTSVTVQTPYWVMMAFSAGSKSQQKPVSDAVVNEVMAQHTLRFSAALVSTTLTANDRAGILIRQDGRLVQPIANDLKHDERAGVVKQTLTTEFDPKTLNLKKPMTVIVLNVELPAVGTAPARHEIRYTLDPARGCELKRFGSSAYEALGMGGVRGVESDLPSCDPLLSAPEMNV